MNSAYMLESLTLSAFRAYLTPATFTFRPKRSLAVFAPNGNGKTSLIDALDFMFSDDGTLTRLGVKTTDNQGGVQALAHARADEKAITPSVAVEFRRGNEKLGGARSASGSQRERPAVAGAVKARFVVDPIIRGHELRAFVEDQTAQQRYDAVARWLDLGALVDVQNNLRALRRTVKADAESDAALQSVHVQLRRTTANAVQAWDENDVLAYVNGLLALLGDALALGTFDAADAAMHTLRTRATVEGQQIGLFGLQQLHTAATRLAEEQDKDGAQAVGGLLPDYPGLVARATEAVVKEQEERAAAATAMFENLWQAAESLFAEGAPVLATCPLCTTPISESAAGSSEAVRAHIATHRADLADYAAAKEALGTAVKARDQHRAALSGALETFSGLLTPADAGLKASVDSYAAALAGAAADVAPGAATLTAHILALVQTTASAIAAIEAVQGDNTYAKALTKVEALFELQKERHEAERMRAELAVLHAALNDQAQFIGTEIRKKVQSVLDTLQTSVNNLYKAIQRDAAHPVRLELPTDEEAAQHRLQLVVDFAANRKSVPPSGYLSDSQIHSLALALRLAAIRLCNKGAPLIVLDDIVTSYDADHRVAIAAMLAEHFTDCQIIIATHDERFFLYLKDRLPEADWRFTRITYLDPEHGPRFSDQRITDAEITARWAKGDSAANEMRTAEEEWLLAIGRGFGIDVRIRAVERALSYERSELASSLAVFLKDRGYAPPAVPGIKNRFLDSLQKGVVENFGSHFQDGQYGAGSIGDEKARWQEFTFFRDRFVCACGKARFKRPTGMQKPVCANEKCEAQFAFLPAPANVAVA